MNICSLPDLCHLVIFDYLKITDLLKFDRVSRRWNALKVSSCKRRKKLEIYVKHPYVRNDYNQSCDRNRLTVCVLDENVYKNCIEIFANVKILSIGGLYFEKNEISQIANLLSDMWSKKLTSLILYSLSPTDATEEVVNAINSMTSLRKLALCFFISIRKIQKLSIISQLESFTYQDHDGLSELTALFRQQFRLNSLVHLNSTQIDVWFTGIPDRDELYGFLSLNPKIAQKITNLGILSYLDNSLFKEYCDHFTSMSTVDLNMKCFTKMDQPFITKCLASLPKLKNLKLVIQSKVLLDTKLTLTPLLVLTKLTLTIYQSITRLGNVAENVDENIAPLNLSTYLQPAKTFPNITNLHLQFYKTTKCVVCLENIWEINEHSQKICVLHSIEAFNACPKLVQIIVAFEKKISEYENRMKWLINSPFGLEQIRQIDE